MEEVISTYLTTLDELNTLTSTSYYTATNDLNSRINKITDDILSFLIKAYVSGVHGAATMLGHELGANVGKMDEAIYLVIDGKTYADRVADHVLNNDLPGLQALVQSEFHRVYNAGTYDGAKDYADNGSFGVIKTWFTMFDDKVRDTHRYLEKQSVPLEQEFYTWDGDHAAYPGGFAKAENNCGCRCIVKLSTDE